LLGCVGLLVPEPNASHDKSFRDVDAHDDGTATGLAAAGELGGAGHEKFAPQDPLSRFSVSAQGELPPSTLKRSSFRFGSRGCAFGAGLGTVFAATVAELVGAVAPNAAQSPLGGEASLLAVAGVSLAAAAVSQKEPDDATAGSSGAAVGAACLLKSASKPFGWLKSASKGFACPKSASKLSA
jgi:hypothetical protein